MKRSSALKNIFVLPLIFVIPFSLKSAFHCYKLNAAFDVMLCECSFV